MRVCAEAISSSLTRKQAHCSSKKQIVNTRKSILSERKGPHEKPSSFRQTKREPESSGASDDDGLGSRWRWKDTLSQEFSVAAEITRRVGIKPRLSRCLRAGFFVWTNATRPRRVAFRLLGPCFVAFRTAFLRCARLPARA